MKVGFNGGIKLEFYGVKMILLSGITEHFSADSAMRLPVRRTIANKQRVQIR